jgi:uncharacterized membrane protein HdeD (DUF308 family)
MDPGDPRRDRGHAQGAGHRHRKPPGGAGQFLGIYWLFSAVLTAARALRTRWKRGSRLGLLAGKVGLAAGLQVLGRHVLEPVVSARFLLDALGVPTVLTGTLRLLEVFEGERRTGRWWTLGGLAPGSVEIVLGAIVLVADSANLRLATVAMPGG